MKRKALIFLLATVMLAAVSYADNAVANIIGTVKGVSASSITVETMDKTPQAITVTVLPSTRFIKDGADVSVKDLKIEDRVVVGVRPNGQKFEATRVVFGQIFQHMDMHHK